MDFADHLNAFVARENCRNLRMDRPLHDWPSEVLVWIFWSDEISKHDPSDRIIEMIHAEMNARGEGERVAV